MARLRVRARVCWRWRALLAAADVVRGGTAIFGRRDPEINLFLGGRVPNRVCVCELDLAAPCKSKHECKWV